jgi:hypothetical protein
MQEMKSEKFFLPEFTIPATGNFDTDAAIRKVRKELNAVFLLAAVLVIFFVFSCYSAASLTTFLIFTGLSAVGLYGLWRFHKRVERTEIGRIKQRIENPAKPFIQPAEELEIDDKGIRWQRAEPQPDQFDIAWNEIKSITFGSIEDTFITLANGQKIKTPLIMHRNREQVAAHIEHFTKLKKSVTERYYGNEKLEDVSYD